MRTRCADKFLCCSQMESNQLSKVPLSSSFLRGLESEDTPNVLCYCRRSMEFGIIWEWLGVGGEGRLLWEIWAENQRVQRVTATYHKDVTRKLQETQSLNFSQGAGIQMWRPRAATGIQPAPSFMPNLKLTSKTSESFWSRRQEVSAIITMPNLLQFCPAKSKRVKVCPVKGVFISFFFLSAFHSNHYLLFFCTCFTRWLYLWSLSNYR